MMMDQSKTIRSTSLVWYIFFGLVHEIGHIVAAIALKPTGSDWPFNASKFQFWYEFLFLRQVSLDLSMFDMMNNDHYANNDATINNFIRWIHHAGWMVSLIVALGISIILRYYQRKGSTSHTVHHQQDPFFFQSIHFAAWLTVVEAMATDLFGMTSLARMGDGPSINNSSWATHTFLCGNFGILLLHQAWLRDRCGRNSALDCLEQMIQITMLRGAQSGGVVTYQPTAATGGGSLKATRRRFVNKKRTDLSKELRKRVGLSSNLPTDFCPFLQGHTRFATSSLSTLEGTHPHQWTPPTTRRIYNFQTNKFQEQIVENFITHNGDLDFYQLNGKTYDVEIVLKWLAKVLQLPAPASVDSMGIAGLVDLIRCQGSFALSARYAIALAMANATMDDQKEYPSALLLDKIAVFLEECWNTFVATMPPEQKKTLDDGTPWSDSITFRTQLATAVSDKLSKRADLCQPLMDMGFLSNNVEDSNSIYAFSVATVHAFLDNDLFYTIQVFLKNAKGSFGLTASSSLDAHRRLVLAARGQSMSIAFYPDKGLICYGSEQAAVKAGLNATFPNVQDQSSRNNEGSDVDRDATRLDLDDLGGEIVLLDWNKCSSSQSESRVVSKPSRHLNTHIVMKGAVTLVIYQESKSSPLDRELYHRLTRLSRNDLIKPLPKFSDDPIRTDIDDIPKICREIQDDFHSSKACSGMNRLTAFHLSNCLKARLEDRIKGQYSTSSVDILLTGCEVSLWLAEQFASDLKKCFPKLAVLAMSSNKILGLSGQEISIPSLGFPYSPQINNFNDAIVIIVSHSGGTFGPLACSNLLQSYTRNIFVVTGDWDTQIGKNLRLMNQLEDGGEHVLNHRIFSTNTGIRPAEPCSLSVVATHQLLTNLLQYISVVILSDSRYRRLTGATITAMDIQVLERCNKMNIEALTEIVGVNVSGYTLDREPHVLQSLRQAGDLWAEHVLENARAYVMCFVYIFTTVIAGYPIAYAIAIGAGLSSDSPWVHAVKIIDAAIYFWCPQICIILLRLWQGRNLLHRMVGRTVVIGDIPWVAQSAEAFLSKIFAVSYSIAGLNVLSANPVDHLVHRYTHRVVRGTLAIFGRPDGRLSALSTAEASVCLSVNQASSIQSWGGTCESITIGHNPFKLDLSLNGIFLKRHRPLFLCERLLVETDAKQEHRVKGEATSEENRAPWRRSALSRLWNVLPRRKVSTVGGLNVSVHRVADCSISLKFNKRRSAPALLGAYLDINERKNVNPNSVAEETNTNERLSVDDVIAEVIRHRRHNDRLHQLFSTMDKDGDGLLNENEFIEGLQSINEEMSENEARVLFRQADSDASARVSYQEFERFVQENGMDVSTLKMPPSHRDKRGIIQIEATTEKYFGETVRKYNAGKRDSQEVDFALARHQHIAQELYETRIASMQRFVSMIVMFHHMGKRVQQFFATISFGLWSYRMDRTHSIMRIATTASPVSGADVRDRMEHLRLLKKVQHSVAVISQAYLSYQQRKSKTTQS